MVFYSKSNGIKQWFKYLLPLYYFGIGLFVGNSFIALLQPPGWVIWCLILVLELLPTKFTKLNQFISYKSLTFLAALQRIRRGILLAIILDAFRLGS